MFSPEQVLMHMLQVFLVNEGLHLGHLALASFVRQHDHGGEVMLVQLMKTRPLHVHIDLGGLLGIKGLIPLPWGSRGNCY